jgi:hypothetical protein
MTSWLQYLGHLRFLPVPPVISTAVFTSSITQIVNSNLTHVLICFAGGLLSFLPLVIGLKSNLEDSTLKNSLSSGYYFRDSSMASLALAIPISIDIVLDVTTLFAKKRKICGPESQMCLNNIEKCLLLIGITSIPLTSFLPYDLPNIGLVFFCCQKFQLVIVAGIVMTSLCRNNKKFWTAPSTITFLIILGSATSMSIFARNASLSRPDDRVRQGLNLACVFTSLAPICYLIYCNIRWLTDVIRTERKCSPHVTGMDRKSDSHIFFTTIWVITTLIGMILQALIHGVYLNVDHFDSKALLMNNLIFLCFELSITVFLMRVVKSDVLHGLVSSLRLCHKVLIIFHPQSSSCPVTKVLKIIHTIVVRPYRFEENVRAIHLPRAPHSPQCCLPRIEAAH